MVEKALVICLGANNNGLSLPRAKTSWVWARTLGKGQEREFSTIRENGRGPAAFSPGRRRIWTSVRES